MNASQLVQKMQWSVVCCSQTSLWVYYAFLSFPFLPFTSPQPLIPHSSILDTRKSLLILLLLLLLRIPQKPTMPSLCAPENLITVSDYPVQRQPPPESRTQILNDCYYIIAVTHRLAHTIMSLSRSNDPRDRTELLRGVCDICEDLLRRVAAIGMPWEEWMEVDREIGMLMRVSVVGYEVLGERVRACRR